MKFLRRSLPLVVSCILIGCGTLPKDMTDAEKQATAAATTAHSVQEDILVMKVLERVTNESLKTPSPSAVLVCTPTSPSVELTSTELGAFADAINAVSKVATKPDDTSYAGYLAAFKKNQEVIDSGPPDLTARANQEKQKSDKAVRDCIATFNVDSTAKLQGPKVLKGAALGGALNAQIVSLDALIKTLLSVTEQAQRAVAVRKAMQYMVPVLQDITAKLSQPVELTDYVLTDASNKPLTKTRLANTIVIHRWVAFQRLQDDWNQLPSCGVPNKPSPNCRGTAENWRVAEQFATDVETYRALAAIDPDQTLEQLSKAVSAVSQNLDNQSIGNILDGLSAIASAISSINDKNAAFRKTLN